MVTADDTSTQQPLGRLERVELREQWAREDTGFTTWLAEAENLRLLGSAIGLELELEAQEKSVGPFSADLLCKDTATGSWVVIENQIERTDHRHLGQIMTYAAGLGATTIVWIAQRFTDEHRAALDWLNGVTREGIDFFGLEIELWRIGTSPAAPKFNIVAKPNDWQKRVAGGGEGRRNGVLSQTQRTQLEFWTAFHEYLLEHAVHVKPGRPAPQAWMNVGMGGGGFVLNAVASTWDSDAGKYTAGELRVDVLMQGRNAKRKFAALQRRRDYIDERLGEQTVWVSTESSQACRICLRRVGDLQARTIWPEYFAWLAERLDRMYELFIPLARQVRNEEGEGMQGMPA